MWFKVVESIRLTLLGTNLEENPIHELVNSNSRSCQGRTNLSKRLYFNSSKLKKGTLKLPIWIMNDIFHVIKMGKKILECTLCQFDHVINHYLCMIVMLFVLIDQRKPAVNLDPTNIMPCAVLEESLAVVSHTQRSYP